MAFTSVVFPTPRSAGDDQRPARQGQLQRLLVQPFDVELLLAGASLTARELKVTHPVQLTLKR